jgi:L-fuculose-phosphate aldolase
VEIYNIKKLVCEAGVRMLEMGLVVGTWGNISIRVDDCCMVITPSGMDYQRLKPEEMVVMNIQDLSHEGHLKPSIEGSLHAAIYRARPGINAIIHNHSTSACSLAAARKDIPPILDDMVQIVGGAIRVAEYSLPGTEELGRKALEALEDRNAVLLANHGAVCLGRTIDEAFVTAMVVEKACRVFLDSQCLGGPVELSPSDVAFMRKFFLDQYGQR